MPNKYNRQRRKSGVEAANPAARRHPPRMGTLAMTDRQLLDRIALDPKVVCGKPVIKGTRLTVDFILNLLARGTTAAEILAEYEGLAAEDIQACLLFAAKALETPTFVPLTGETA
jgi:uncharacterized protein (DUF433 family)